MAWSDLPKSQQMAVAIGIPVIIAVILIYMLHGALKMLGPDPALQAIHFAIPDRSSSHWAKIEKKLEQIDELEEKLEEEDAVHAELVALKKAVREREEQLPNNEDVPEIRQWLQDIAANMSSEVGQMTFLGVSITRGGSKRGRGSAIGYNTVTYKCQFEGDMNGLLYYLDRVETDPPRFMNVASFSITPGSVGADLQNLEVTRELHKISMDIVTYVYLDDTSGGRS
jgi:hypothetical protein